MPDKGHMETEALLRALEKRIAAEYRKANREITRKVNAYMSEFKRKDKEWREKLENGDITEAEYKAWQTGQVMIGKRWEEMRHTLAQDYANTNDLAKQMAFDSMPDVYALNHNYATFEVEKGGKVDTSYTLYDRPTVERLIRDDPKLLPDPRPGSPLAQKLAKHKELRWEEQHVQSVVLQSVLQGESLEQTAKRFTQLTEMNYRQSVRYARTATTGAQNAGRVDGYKRAEKLGVNMKQVWLSTLDSRTRHEHRVLDGQEVDVGEPFIMDGFKIKYPGDPAAPAHLLYNCRCTVIAKVKGVDFDVSDKTQRDDKIGDMSYEEWKNDKQKAPKPPENVPEGKAVEVKVSEPTKGEYKEEPIKPIKLETDIFPENVTDNINASLERMDRNVAKKYRDSLDKAEKKISEDGTAYSKRANAINFNVDEIDTLNADTAIHEATHYIDFNTPMVYEHTSTRRVWARDENDNLLEKDGKPYRTEETETIRYDCKSVTSWISFAYEDEERESDWEKAVSIIGVTKENATPFGDWIKADDLTKRREAYRQWIKEKGISQEDLPHISDVLSSFAEGQYPFSLIDGGHELSYWNEDVAHQYSECLAAYSVLKSRNSPSVKVIEEICPNLYKHLEKGYKEMFNL